MSIKADNNDFEITNNYIMNKVLSQGLKGLEFDRIFEEKGKQGIVGLMNIKDDHNESPMDQCVFKSSRYINHLVTHEKIVMEGLNELRPFCPHFCKSFGTIKNHVDGHYRKSENPFEVVEKYPIEIDTLLIEYITGKNLYTMMKENKLSIEAVFSIVKQTLLAISIAQKYKKFTHYDLHGANILLKECDEDTVFLYILDEENQFYVPTYGYYPVIIDFGFSHIEDLNNNPIYSSLAHTDVGFMTNQFDMISDAKLFLVTTSDDVKRFKNCKEGYKFRNIVRNIFAPLDLDWESGWDNIDKISAADYILEKLEDIEHSSLLFSKFEHFCIDIIQSLIYLPLKPRSSENMEVAFKTFVNEFSKIEKDISSSFHNLYILKNICDIVREERVYYEKKETRKESVKRFKNKLYDVVSSIAKNCYPTKVNCEKMICSLLVFSKCVEGMLYETTHKIREDLDELHEKLPLKRPEQIFAAIEANIPSKYTITSETTVYVWDSINKTNDTITIPEEYLDIINNVPPLAKGTALYDFYTGNLRYEDDEGSEGEGGEGSD